MNGGGSRGGFRGGGNRSGGGFGRGRGNGGGEGGFNKSYSNSGSNYQFESAKNGQGADEVPANLPPVEKQFYVVSYQLISLSYQRFEFTRSAQA